MSWAVVDAVEEAFEDTKELLFPFDLKTWATLGLIAFLAGGSGMSMPNFPTGGSGSDFSSPSYEQPDSLNQPDIPETSTAQSPGIPNEIPGSAVTGSFSEATSSMTAAIVIVAAALTGLVLLMMLLSSIFKFIYFQSLIDDKVRIRGNFRSNLNNGARYFIFRFLLTLGMLGLVAGAIFMVIANPLTILPLILFALPFFIIFGALTTLIHDFALIEMLKNDKKLIAAIRTMFGVFRQEWQQTLIYLVLKLVLNFAVGLIGLILGLIILVILLIPFGILGFIAFNVNLIAGIIVVIFGLLTFFSLSITFIMGPANTFTYYYALNSYEGLRN